MALRRRGRARSPKAADPSLVLWSRARRYDERHHVLLRLEARAVRRSRGLRGERTHAYATPRPATRHVRLDDVRLVTTNAELLSKRVRFLTCLEGAHLELVAAVVTGRRG